MSTFACRGEEARHLERVHTSSGRPSADGDDGYDGDEYDDASEELSRRRRRRARAASLALLAEADSSYELAAKIFRSIEGSVGSAAYEELVVRMDLVDDAIAEERRKGREDRERASL